MKKIAWVVDSTAYLDEDLKNHPDVYTVPLTIVMDNEEILDKSNLSTCDFFKRLKTLKSPPKTSQPSIGVFKKLFEKLQKDYDAVVSILLSSKLSGTVSSSQQASQLVDIPVYTIDSKIISYPITVQLKKGMEWLASGLSLDLVKEKIEQLRETYEAYVLVGDLEQLRRSGRLSGLQFFLGSLLNIKPIIEVKNGELSVKERVRSDKQAKKRMVQFLRQSYEKYKFKEVYLLYGFHLDETLKWKEELKSKFPNLSFKCYPLGRAIGVHTGENTVGISWYNTQNE